MRVQFLNPRACQFLQPPVVQFLNRFAFNTVQFLNRFEQFTTFGVELSEMVGVALVAAAA